MNSEKETQNLLDAENFWQRIKGTKTLKFVAIGIMTVAIAVLEGSMTWQQGLIAVAVGVGKLLLRDGEAKTQQAVIKLTEEVKAKNGDAQTH